MGVPDETPGVESVSGSAADPAAELSPRDRVAQGLSGYLSSELLEKLLGEVMALEKVAWGSCKGCGKRVQISVPDARAVTSSLVDLLKEGYGTPNAGDTERAIVVNRTVGLVCDSGSPCQCETCRGAVAA